MKVWLIRVKLVFFMLLILSEHAVGAALGMPEYTDRFGVSLAVSSISVEDPLDSTDSLITVQPVNLVYVRAAPLSLWRSWAEAYYHRTAFDADQDVIGITTVEQIGVRLSLQRPLNPSSTAEGRLYVGGGLQLAYNQYQERHDVDSEGFLDSDPYEDRAELQQSLLVHLFYEVPLGSTWLGGLKLEHAIPVNDDIRQTSLSFVVLF